MKFLKKVQKKIQIQKQMPFYARTSDVMFSTFDLSRLCDDKSSVFFTQLSTSYILSVSVQSTRLDFNIQLLFSVFLRKS